MLESITRMLLVAGFLSASGLALSHHSFSVFDMETQKTLSGKIVGFEWTNPHTWTWVDVTASDGVVTRWGLEGMSPNYLGRRGWTKNTLKPGDSVELVISPLRSGEPGGTLLRAILADGSTQYMFGGP
ncbi:MAG: DUF6152 family protein [Pseudomonadales bacterium]|nr:DUF6152 family protein [Pseudomonadales bacterium]